jgi:holo-[acyl-carrier protein] synthase
MKIPCLRVGVDMVSIPELASMVETSGPTFLDSCWTRTEQAYCDGSIPRLAARWAAKEATMKALGHGIGEIDPLDVEVHAVEGAAPGLRLHNMAADHARAAGLDELVLSLTHEANFALAFVVAYGAGPGTRDLDRSGIVRLLADGVAAGRAGLDSRFLRGN